MLQYRYRSGQSELQRRTSNGNDYKQADNGLLMSLIDVYFRGFEGQSRLGNGIYCAYDSSYSEVSRCTNMHDPVTKRQVSFTSMSVPEE